MLEALVAIVVLTIGVLGSPACC
ncbi:hypothetical protein [Cupriavidus necator]